MRSLCVIILNYGTPRLTVESAKSALEDLADIDGEIVIVDNASPDDSYEQFVAWRQSLEPTAPVSIVRSPENSGYAGGNNLGLRSGDAKYYILLNSDTLVRKGAFGAMLATMQANPDIGMLGPTLIGPDGKPLISRFRHPTPVSEFVEATGTGIVYRLFRNYVVPIRHEETAELEWIGFPCVMFRKAMVDDIGLLDERYFMYFEDIAYCRRATQSGWKIAQCPEAEVDHFCGQSSQVEAKADSKERLPPYYYASRARYFTTSYGRAGFVAANVLWYLGRAVSYLRVLALRAPTKVCDSRARDIWTSPDTSRPA